MKKLIAIAFIFGSLSLQAQNTSFSYQPYFSAVVVKDMAKSKKFYESVFGLKVKSEMKDSGPDPAYNVLILESPNYLLELLELKGSLQKETYLKGKPKGTEMQGHFKIGFKITNADAWLKRFKELNIDVPNLWADEAGKKSFLINDPDGNLIQFFE